MLIKMVCFVYIFVKCREFCKIIYYLISFKCNDIKIWWYWIIVCDVVFFDVIKYIWILLYILIIFVVFMCNGYMLFKMLFYEYIFFFKKLVICFDISIFLESIYIFYW